MKLPFQLERPLAFLDLETTGLSTVSDRIVELAVIRVSPQGDVLERVRRFNPGIPISPEATEVHGITDADVAHEPSFAARARSLAALLDPCDLAGFNLRRFDLPLLLAEFKRAGVPFSPGSDASSTPRPSSTGKSPGTFPPPPASTWAVSTRRPIPPWATSAPRRRSWPPSWSAIPTSPEPWTA